jgi:hypothetical protein
MRPFRFRRDFVSGNPKIILPGAAAKVTHDKSPGNGSALAGTPRHAIAQVGCADGPIDRLCNAAAQLNFAKLPELLRKPWSLNKNGASGA